MLAVPIQETDSLAGELAEVRRIAPLRGAALRHAAQLTLADVARQIGTSVQTISNWERGLALPTGERAIAYLGLLRELERLLGWQGA